MRAEELMIGDWVQIVSDAPIMANEYHRIDWIRTGEVGLDNRKIVTYPYIQPIPLTADILYKNGFKDTDIIVIGHRRVQWSGDDGRTIVTIWMDDSKEMDIVKDGYLYLLPSPSAVHHLQHILHLCGIEHEITL